MARLIGEIPRELTKAEQVLYEFLSKELPDYITIGFHIMIDGFEMDAVLLVPHMGVFILEVRSGGELTYREGRLYINDRMGGTRVFRPEQTKMYRYQMKRYMHRHFHINPLVYELNCFPLLRIQKDALEKMQGMENHFLFQEDFADTRTFLLKLFKFYTASAHLGPSDTRRENDPVFYDDLDDEAVFEITGCWGQQPVERLRPSKPPVAFLSYNRNNQTTAKLIQKELEKRGVFTWKAPMDVPFGEDYLVHEMEAIRGCAAFVILLSPASQESHEVRIEFEEAMRSKKKIYPIVLGNFDINDYYLKALQQIEWRVMENNDVSFLDEIVNALKG